MQWLVLTSSTAQGSWGSFKDRKPIGGELLMHGWQSEPTDGLRLWDSDFLSLSLPPSIDRWIDRSTSLSVYLFTSLSVYLSICLSVYLSVCLSFFPSFFFLSFLSFFLPFFLFLLSIGRSFYLPNPIDLSFYLSVCLSIHLSTHPSIHRSICLSVYLPC